jgi:hypothetical protein
MFFFLGCYAEFFRAKKMLHGDVRCMFCDPWEGADDTWMLDPFGVDRDLDKWGFPNKPKGGK